MDAGTVLSYLAVAMTTDGRFPTGGYSHSHGLEQAISRGHIRPEDPFCSLARWLRTQLQTVVITGAAQSAWAAHHSAIGHGDLSAVNDRSDLLILLDSEIDARTPSPRAREVSRSLGRRLITNLLVGWTTPSTKFAEIRVAPVLPEMPGLCGEPFGGVDGIEGALAPLELLAIEVASPHLSEVTGCFLGCLGTSPVEAAAAWCYNCLVSHVSAAVKLLGMDPVSAFGLLPSLGDIISDVVAEASHFASRPASELPSYSFSLADALLEEHATRKDRLFAS